MKIVINKKYGNFVLSEKCLKHMAELGSDIADEILKENYRQSEYDKFWAFYGSPAGMCTDENSDSILRTSKELIKAIEDLGDKCDTESCKFKIVEVPDDLKWHIEQQEGCGEMIVENSRIFY